MTQPLTLGQALFGFAVLVASVATVALAVLAFVADHEQDALVFTLGGAGLAVWSAVRLCVR